jgi:hypothetical protein
MLQTSLGIFKYFIYYLTLRADQNKTFWNHVKALHLRLACGTRFQLPMNEKIIMTAKVNIFFEEITKPYWLSSR